MSKNIIEIALNAGFINTSNGLESPFIEGEDLTDNLKLFASLLLAQPEQEQEVLKKDWVKIGYIEGRKEGYKRGYKAGHEDYKQKLINAFGIDDE